MVHTFLFFLTTTLLLTALGCQAEPIRTKGEKKVYVRKKYGGKALASIYNGEMSNGIPDGHGEEVVIATNGRYIGQFKDGKYHGHGTLYIGQEKVYEGEWEYGFRADPMNWFWFLLPFMAFFAAIGGFGFWMKKKFENFQEPNVVGSDYDIKKTLPGEEIVKEEEAK